MTTAIDFAVPEGACDCHTHVFEDAARFPFGASRGYAPPPATADEAPNYGDVAPLARALITANPDRIVWGTDWPHPHAPRPGAAVTGISPPYDIDDGLVLNQLPLWAPEAAIRRKILVENPVRAYDF